MRQTWRWFGPKDLVSIDDMLQAGVEGVVTALHHMQDRRHLDAGGHSKAAGPTSGLHEGWQAASGLAWEVVESLPVSEDIKKQKGAWREHIENYKVSLRNLKDAGIDVICYNFMPVLDWTRTNLAWRTRTGATCMRFDYVDFAAFDLFLLATGGRRQATTRKRWSRTRESASHRHETRP